MSETDTVTVAKSVDEPPLAIILMIINTGDGKNLGTAASKDYTTSVTSGSSDLVTSGAVYTAINDSGSTIKTTLYMGNSSYPTLKPSSFSVVPWPFSTSSAHINDESTSTSMGFHGYYTNGIGTKLIYNMSTKEIEYSTMYQAALYSTYSSVYYKYNTLYMSASQIADALASVLSEKYIYVPYNLSSGKNLQFQWQTRTPFMNSNSLPSAEGVYASCQIMTTKSAISKGVYTYSEFISKITFSGNPRLNVGGPYSSTAVTYTISANQNGYATFGNECFIMDSSTPELYDGMPSSYLIITTT